MRSAVAAANYIERTTGMSSIVIRVHVSQANLKKEKKTHTISTMTMTMTMTTATTTTNNTWQTRIYVHFICNLTFSKGCIRAAARVEWHLLIYIFTEIDFQLALSPSH